MVDYRIVLGLFYLLDFGMMENVMVIIYNIYVKGRVGGVFLFFMEIDLRNWLDFIRYYIFFIK